MGFTYTKLIKGFCEIIYDHKGNPLGQRFVPLDSEPVDRRMIRPPGTPMKPGEYEDDELISNPEDVTWLEGQEKYCPMEMVPPPAPLGISKTTP
jgi:hypothetical protein